jgi:hypothetical protein
MTAPVIVAAVLVLAVVLGWARLWWGQRVRGSRLALLAVAQPVLAALLYFGLFPPPERGEGAAVLTVATRGASVGADVALPEAPVLAGTARVPDLATALRQHPGTRTVRVIGEGLEARDRDAVRGVGIAFDPPAPRRGLVALVPSPRVAPGAAFRVGGAAAGVSGGSGELLDPAGVVNDRVPLDARGGFVLAGAARVPGVALFGVRIRDAKGAVADTVPVPVVTAAGTALRVLFLAGAPGPEVKYWRRWAADAGLDATVGMSAGAGIDLGDPVPALTPATLARTDVLVVDERRWAALGGARGAVLAAVRGGMGLVVRVTGAGTIRVPEAPLTAGRGTRPVKLTGLPALTRWDVLAPGAIVGLRDEAGAPLFGWQGLGRGRIGVWTLGDAAGLVTAGFGDRYGAWWSEALAAVARPVAGSAVTVSDWPVAGERMRVCGADAVVAPDGTRTALVATPGTRCAGFWPRVAGWHVAAGLPFHVADASEIAGLRAEVRRTATLALVGPGDAPSGEAAPREGRSWPWLLAFLIVAGGVWWVERRRRGIAAAAPNA